MKNIKQLEEKRTVKKTSSEIQEFAESTVEMFGGEKEEVEADCKMFLLDTIFDQFGKNITIKKKNDDEFTLILDTNLMGFKFWVLRNIDAVEVIRPIKLRNEIRKIVEEVKKKYEK